MSASLSPRSAHHRKATLISTPNQNCQRFKGTPGSSARILPWASAAHFAAQARSSGRQGIPQELTRANPAAGAQATALDGSAARERRQPVRYHPGVWPTLSDPPDTTNTPSTVGWLRPGDGDHACEPEVQLPSARPCQTPRPVNMPPSNRQRLTLALALIATATLVVW